MMNIRHAVQHMPVSAALSGLMCSMAAMSAYAGESYVQVGVPGVVVGYAWSISHQLSLRADAGTTGTLDGKHDLSGVGFETKAQYNRAGMFADYFPFGGGLRLSAGLTLNKAQLDLNSRFNGASSITVNGRAITPAASDYYNAQLKFPALMPYIGVGWGHQARPAGLGFVADLGVSIGRAKYTADTNLVGKTYSGYTVTQADVDSKTAEINDNIGRITLLPSVSVGLNYRY
jgi:hypothetical protein